MFTQNDLNHLCALIFMGAQEHGVDVNALLRGALEKVHYDNKAAIDTPITTAFKQAINYGAAEEKRLR